MTQEKMTKMVTGIVVAATVLLAFLFGFLVYQWITLGVQGHREQQLLQQKEALQQELATQEGILGGILTEDEIMTDLAIQNGFVSGSND
ncbi:MAG: hypothetical protein IJX98_06640 [Clostridia bacterium]|nr:hypothetical protein [Clostridia bacterium]